MASAAQARVEILADAEALAHRVADWLLEAALAKTGTFAIALAGGSTPRRLYEVLAAPPHRDAFPWSRTNVFWGDERFVARDDPASNYRMARAALLAHVPIPDANAHPIPVDSATPEAAAAAYEHELGLFHRSAALTPECPLFDVVLLGMGRDGHTASLFPGTPMLEEATRWVVAVSGVTSEPRITLTYPALQSSRDTAFIIAGESKRPALARVLRGDRALPAARLRPLGRLWFFVDRAAAPEDRD